MLVILFLFLSRYKYRMFIKIYNATSPFNLHREMDKAFSPSYSSSQITYVEVEAVDFLRFHFRFRFHRKRNKNLIEIKI